MNTYDKIKRSERVELLNNLKSAVIDNKEKESDLNKPILYISYKIAHRIARKSRSFSINPFIVKPDNVNKFKSIVYQLKAKNFIAFSLALNESTNIAQLAIFIRGVNSNPFIIKEFLNIISLKDTTREDILSNVEEAVESINLSWDKLTSVATDGAAAIIGRNAGFVGRLKSKFMRQSRQEIHSIFCIIIKRHCVQNL
ncbi:GT2D2 protein, partial [Acromyrmex insinuator]